MQESEYKTYNVLLSLKCIKILISCSIEEQLGNNSIIIKEFFYYLCIDMRQ